MRRKQLIVSCAGSFLLVLSSASYAADTPAEGTVNPTPEVAANPTADAIATPAPEAAVTPPAEAASNPASSCGRATSRYRDDFCSCWTEGPD